MNRTLKNIIMVLIIVIAVVLSYFTMDYAKNNLTSQGNIGEVGEFSNSENEPSTIGEGADSPDMPDGESMSSESETVPEKPSGDSSNVPSDMGEGNDAPEIPNGEDMSSEDGTVPEKPSGDSSNTPSDMGEGNGNMQSMDSNSMEDMDRGGMQSAELTTVYYVVFALEALVVSLLLSYLLVSGFNKKTMKETLKGFNGILIYLVLVVLLTAIFTFIEVYLTNEFFLDGNTDFSQDNVSQGEMMEQPESGSSMNSNSSSSSEAEGSTVVNGETATLNGSYETSEVDESVILVTNGGNLTLENATVSKTGGDSSNTENSEFYGINAGILVTESSTATITGATISTNATGSNAVFSTGEDSKIYISDSVITTTGSSSARGLDATYGGYIEADNVTITTAGGSCATLATDRGEGTVIATNSTLETNGTGSPVIYSTGNISITDTTGTANNAQLVVVEGKNSATVTSSTLYATGRGNRNDVDNAGVMLYQSMSGDADEGVATFTAEDSTLTILSTSNYYTTAPMFFITNTEAVINLTNTKLVYGSNILLSIKGTSEWGNSGSNGGVVTLNATNQVLSGDIELDNISELTLNLTSSSSYEGTINGDNSAKSVTLTLDSTSQITLTGDSYVTSLEDSDTSYSNIDFNGYTLYVNGVAIN